MITLMLQHNGSADLPPVNVMSVAMRLSYFTPADLLIQVQLARHELLRSVSVLHPEFHVLLVLHSKSPHFSNTHHQMLQPWGMV